jgi:hypothetical protein
VLDLDRQFAHANARRVIGGRGDGGGDAGQADLADPAGAKFVDLFVESALPFLVRRGFIHASEAADWDQSLILALGACAARSR